MEPCDRADLEWWQPLGFRTTRVAMGLSACGASSGTLASRVPCYCSLPGVLIQAGLYSAALATASGWWLRKQGVAVWSARCVASDRLRHSHPPPLSGLIRRPASELAAVEPRKASVRRCVCSLPLLLPRLPSPLSLVSPLPLPPLHSPCLGCRSLRRRLSSLCFSPPVLLPSPTPSSLSPPLAFSLFSSSPVAHPRSAPPGQGRPACPGDVRHPGGCATRELGYPSLGAGSSRCLAPNSPLLARARTSFSAPRAE